MTDSPLHRSKKRPSSYCFGHRNRAYWSYEPVKDETCQAWNAVLVKTGGRIVASESRYPWRTRFTLEQIKKSRRGRKVVKRTPMPSPVRPKPPPDAVSLYQLSL